MEQVLSETSLEVMGRHLDQRLSRLPCGVETINTGSTYTVSKKQMQTIMTEKYEFMKKAEELRGDVLVCHHR